MPRNGTSIRKSADTPDEIYDTLSQTDQDAFDAISRVGFRPDRDEKLRWFALSTTADKKIGPKPTLSDLAIAVQEAAPDADSNVIKLPTNSKGDRFLEGMEPIVDAEIAKAAGEYHALKNEHGDATRRLKTAKDDLAVICHSKKDLFKTDPENTADKIYKVGDIVIRMHNEFTEKITTELAIEE